MGSPPTTELAFLDEAGARTETPAEWTPGVVVVPAHPDQLSEVEVTRNGEALEAMTRVIGGTPRIIVDWPRSPAGTYRLSVRIGDGAWFTTASWFVEPSKL